MDADVGPKMKQTGVGVHHARLPKYRRVEDLFTQAAIGHLHGTLAAGIQPARGRWC